MTIGLVAFEPVHRSNAGDELTATAGAKESTRPIEVTRDLVYRQIGDSGVRADMYRPADDGVYPLVLVIHGGAWSAGDKWQVQDHARELAQAGFVAVAINYRLAPKHDISEQVEDCRQALLWAEQQADTWNADASRLALWGYSAGGHLAAFVATSPQSGSPRVCAVVAGGAPCEFSFVPAQSQALAHVMGDTRQNRPENYRKYSPLTHATEDDCPIFFFHGTEDLLVPPSSSQMMYDKLCELDVACEYYAVEDRGHLLAFIDPKARRRAIDFLKKHTAEKSPTEEAH